MTVNLVDLDLETINVWTGRMAGDKDRLQLTRNEAEDSVATIASSEPD